MNLVNLKFYSRLYFQRKMLTEICPIQSKLSGNEWRIKALYDKVINAMANLTHFCHQAGNLEMLFSQVLWQNMEISIQ